MKKLLIPAVLALLVLVLAAPADAAEAVFLSCKACDKVDIVGKGLQRNAELQLVIRDVRTGQAVIPNPTKIATDATGGFDRSFPVNLGDHGSLQAQVYSTDGSDVVIAAHSRFTAPGNCAKIAGLLPYTGTSSLPLVGVAAVLMLSGGLLVRFGRLRARHLGDRP